MVRKMEAGWKLLTPSPLECTAVIVAVEIPTR